MLYRGTLVTDIKFSSGRNNCACITVSAMIIQPATFDWRTLSINAFGETNVRRIRVRGIKNIR